MTDEYTDDYSHDDVPEVIGSMQDSTQMANCIRRGYAAYVNNEPTSANPYIKKPWENFSGFKRRKQKLWAGGWKLAAVREGSYRSLEHVEEDFDEMHPWKPRAPCSALYDRGYGTPIASETVTGEYAYKPVDQRLFETRHDCIGYSAIKARDSLSGNPTYAKAVERVRKPLIEERHRTNE